MPFLSLRNLKILRRIHLASWRYPRQSHSSGTSTLIVCTKTVLEGGIRSIQLGNLQNVVPFGIN